MIDFSNVAAAHLDPRQAGLDARRQVDDEVGLRERLGERRRRPCRRSASPRRSSVRFAKILSFGERVVGDDELLEEVHLRDLLLLAVAREQEVDLRLERRALACPS